MSQPSASTSQLQSFADSTFERRCDVLTSTYMKVSNGRFFLSRGFLNFLQRILLRVELVFQMIWQVFAKRTPASVLLLCEDLKQAQSNCDIFRQGGTEMVD